MTSGAAAPGARAGRLETALAALALVLAVLFAFGPALRAGFVNWDDPLHLLENPHYRGLSRAHLTWMATTSWMGPYQPLAWLTFAIDHQLWGLSGPREYPEAGRWHATSLVWHALAAVALFAAALRLFERVAPRSQARTRLVAAWLAAAAFALHPLRVESVAWLTERRDVVSGAFAALCLWAWCGWVRAGEGTRGTTRAAWAGVALSLAALALFWASVDTTSPAALAWRGPGAVGLAGAALCGLAACLAAARGGLASVGPRRHVLAAACFALSLAGKGTGTPLPLALLVLDLWPLRRARWTSPAALARALAEKAPLFALSAAAARLAVWGQAGQGEAFVSWQVHTLSERALQAVYGLAWYAAKTLAPGGLSAMHELPLELSWREGRFALALGAAGAALVLAVALRKRAPLFAGTLSAYALLLLPVLGLLQAGPQLVAERYSYLPGMALGLGLGGAALALVRARSLSPATWIAAGTLALPLVLATQRQTRTWHDSASLWEHALAVDPDSPAAHQFLALVRMEQALDERDVARKRALLDEARELLERGYALGAAPRFLEYLRDVHVRRAQLAPDAGAAAVEAEAALAYSRRALELSDGSPRAHLRHAELCLRFERSGEARNVLEALARAPRVAVDFWPALGQARAAQGDFALAEEAYSHALQRDDARPSVWHQLGLALEAQGRLDEALAAHERALALDPAHLGAGQARARLSRR
jgi:tetratricopeptide (TPR) repeat protein